MDVQIVPQLCWHSAVNARLPTLFSPITDWVDFCQAFPASTTIMTYAHFKSLHACVCSLVCASLCPVEHISEHFSHSRRVTVKDLNYWIGWRQIFPKSFTVPGGGIQMALWSPDFSSSLPWGWHLWFWMKCLHSYWIDCHDIWLRLNPPWDELF